ncbi:MAG TPA: immunoglobulin domain-containing protein [Verrucomicrobiae bacterium]|nr:immunoglobulin domain-containing protein [Verrucomicrobiae bacterium]
MRTNIQRHAILLAALLQVLPVVRNFFTSPGATSAFAYILRWGVGTTAALGAFDSVSGATSVFTSPSTFNGSVGAYFSNNVVVSIGGGNTASAKSDYVFLSSGSTSSPLLYNGQTTTLNLPPGLTFAASSVNNSKTIGGAIYGTPTAPGSFLTTVTVVSPGNASLSQAITIAITGSVTPTAPGITTQPVGTNIIAGKNAVFTVTAGGTAPLIYTWSKNSAALTDGGNISGSASASLTVANVTSADAGNYSVTVSNSIGGTASSNAVLAVILPPAINAQPLSQTAATGGSAVFSVTASGTGTLAYYWLKNGGALASGTKYSGVNTASLTISNLTTTDAGNFSVIVSNLAGAVTSSNATLAILSSPAISTQPVGRSVATGSNVSFTVAAAASAPLYFFWQKNGGPLADGGNISGTTTATLTLSGVTTNDAATYSVIVSNLLGSVVSSNAPLTVLVPASIIASPANVTVPLRSNASFTITASGTAPLTFSWRKNGNAIVNGGNISGANTATLALASVGTNDVGSYSATVSNSIGGATSAAASLAVLIPPAINAPPLNAMAAAGAIASFGVSVSGTAPLSLQWLKNGALMADGGNVSGSTSNILTLTSVTTNDAAAYSVMVSNILGSITSSSVTLSVILPVGITASPNDVVATVGSNVSFTVTAGGTTPITYLWRKNGTPLANGGNVSGANTATLALASITANDAGGYSVAISNSISGTVSPAATLTVLSPPTITTQPQTATATSGTTATFGATVSGTAPLSFQWLKNGVALADIGNVSGSASNILTIASVTTNDEASYSVLVSNALGNAVSSNAPLVVVMSAGIIIPPANVIAPVGSNVSFSVTTGGTAPITYLWRKNGATVANGGKISGANTATLSLANITPNDAGNYSVAVSNSFGGSVSSAATLTVLVPPSINVQPVNSVVASGAAASFTVTVSGTTPLSLQWFKDGIPLPDGGNLSGTASNILTLTSVTTNDDGGYSALITNIAGNTNSVVAILTVIVPPSILTPPAPVSAILTSNATFTVLADGTAPLTYQWRKNGAAITGANASTLTLANITTTSSANYSVTVSNYAGSVTSGDAALTVLSPPGIVTQPLNQISQLGNPVSLSVIASGTATLMYQWFKGGIALTDGGNFSGSTSNVLTIASLTTNEVDVYFVVISNSYGTVNSGHASVAMNVSPLITLQPASQIVARSNAVAFSVSATGTGPLAYQWRKNGTNISGATAATLTLLNVTTNQNGIYSVRITNIFGSTLSSNASLAVYIPPQISASPTNRTAIQGTNAIFAATVKGTAPFYFQWFKNGIPLVNGGNVSGAGSNILRITSITSVDAAIYSLQVSNPVGSATSSGATLTVLIPPALSLQPVRQSVLLGDPVTFSATATGTAPLRFQWRKAGIPIRAATNANFTISSVTTDDAANYTVMITNLAGSATSLNAKLAVLVAPVFTLQATNRAAKLATTTIFRASAYGTATMAFQWSKNGISLADGGNISGSTSNVLTITRVTTNDAGTYFLTASNLVAIASSSNAILNVLVPPVIVKPVGENFAVLSNSVTMNIVATGTAPMKFQWRKAGAVIRGATNAAFTIAGVKTGDAGIYSVAISNPAGSVISSNGTLTVWIPPTFSLQASNRTARVASTTIFRTVAHGTAPLSFQWFKNGLPLADGANVFGSTSNILTVAGLTQKDAGSYTLLVTNVARGISSSNAILRLGRTGGGGSDDKPSFTSQTATTVINPPLSPTITQIILNGDGTVTLHCHGTGNLDYVLQATPDFVRWTVVSTNTADVNGVWQVTDKMDEPVKFYRIQAVQ